jgi:hypothetical protein
VSELHRARAAVYEANESARNKKLGAAIGQRVRRLAYDNAADAF